MQIQEKEKDRILQDIIKAYKVIIFIFYIIYSKFYASFPIKLRVNELNIIGT